MDIFIFSLNAVLPILLLAVLGFFLKRISFFTTEFLRVANDFCFKFALSTLVFMNVYSIETLDSIRVDVLVFAYAFTLVMFFIGIFYAKVFIKDPMQKGVLVQTFFRANYVIIGLPLAVRLAGPAAQGVASLLAGFVVPFFNVLAVISFTIFMPSNDNKMLPLERILDILKKILKNPLILGGLSGLLCLCIRPYVGDWRFETGELRFLFQTLESLSKIGTPLALLVLGGQFAFSAVKTLLPKIILGVIIRLLITPLVGFIVVLVFFPHFSKAEYAAFLPFFAGPCAVSTAIMAENMGNDGELARQLVVWTSVISAFTLFIFIAILRSFGVF